MIELIVDAMIAAVVLTDRGLTAVEKNVRQLRPFPPAVADDVRPAGAGTPQSSTGGHPIRSTSALLGNAAIELDYAYPNNLPAIISVLIAELRDRAAHLRAVGD